MKTATVLLPLPESLQKQLDMEIRLGEFQTREEACNALLESALRRRAHSRFVRACRSLDPREEQQLAEERLRFGG